LPRDVRVALPDAAEHAALGELVKYAVRELPLRGIVTPVVEGLEAASVFLELLFEERVVGGFPGEAVAILGLWKEPLRLAL
jgi:hypothetical protein